MRLYECLYNGVGVLAKVEGLAATVTNLLLTAVTFKRIGRRIISNGGLGGRGVRLRSCLPTVRNAIHTGCRCRATAGRDHFRIHGTHFDLANGMLPVITCGMRVSLSSRNAVHVLSTCAHVFPIGRLSFAVKRVHIPFAVSTRHSPRRRCFTGHSFVTGRIKSIHSMNTALTCAQGGTTLPFVLRKNLFGNSKLAGRGG